MTDHDPRDIDWGRVLAEAIAIGSDVTSYDAEGVVQEGTMLYFSGEAPWDTTGGTTLPEHLVGTGVDALSKKIPDDDAAQAKQNVHKLRLFEKVLAHFANDQEALDLLLLLQQGISDASEQAKRTGMDIAVVRNARNRIRHYAEDLAKRDEQSMRP